MGTIPVGIFNKPAFDLRYMVFLLLFLIIPAAFAQESKQPCQIDAINEAFATYVTTLDRQQLRNIQGQLNIAGYGPVGLDGIYGPQTGQGLQRLCQDFKLTSADQLALQLISLLEMTATVSQKYPAWRKLIQEEAFTKWLDQKPKKERENDSKTLQSGPAMQVIAILDAYPGAKPATPKQAPSPAPRPAPTVPKSRSADASGPAVFYRWQPDKEEETDSKAEDDSQQDTEDQTLSDDIQQVLTALQGIAYPNEFLFKKALQSRFANSGVKYAPYLDKILSEARNGPVEDFNKIQLSGGDCGCSRDFSSLVYGFYPFWLATDDIQQADFSLFDRIGFYALTLNNKGNIQNTLQWSDDWDVAAFISTAHKYRVDVDVTFYASDWQRWSDKVIENAARNVVKTVVQKFHPGGTAGLHATFPFLEHASAVTTDGLTLVFDNYRNSASSEKIISFVTRVAEKLADVGSDASLNIILGLDMNRIEKAPLFEALSSILLDEEGSKVSIEYVFVFLQEPTTNSKKILRRKIENDFHGLDRKTVLRKVVPVLSPAGHDKDPNGAFTQFTDDLIYLQDNFAGVGLWPLQLQSDKDIAKIDGAIIKLYQVVNGTNHVGAMIDRYAPWLCQFACPNRWLLRIGFDLLAGLLVLYALLAFWICKLRGLFKQYFLYFLAAGLAAVLIMMILLVCDPYWHDRADAVVLTVFLVALVATIGRYVSKMIQPPLP